MALPDIVDCLGSRPYPLKESLLEYLEELRERKVEEDTQAAETPSSSSSPSDTTEQQQGSNTNAASSSDASTTVNKDSEKNEGKDLKQ